MDKKRKGKKTRRLTSVNGKVKAGGLLREDSFVKIEGMEVGEGSKGRRGVYPFISPVETSRHISFQFLPPRSITFIRSRPRSSVFTPRKTVVDIDRKLTFARHFCSKFSSRLRYLLPKEEDRLISRLISLDNLFLEKCVKEEKGKDVVFENNNVFDYVFCVWCVYE